MAAEMTSGWLLGSRVDATNYVEAASLAMKWAHDRESRYVCVACVNNIMEAHDDEGFRSIANGADLVTPDGMPVVWGLRLLGIRHASRVYGPDLSLVVLSAAEREGVAVGFYGSSNAVLERLIRRVRTDFPELEIAYVHAPPYRELTPEEDEDVTEQIRRSKCRILFVGLSTPKQDWWMAGHRNRVDCVMLGVGAAFDFLAGTKTQAPRWMMASGLEWLFRLFMEPRRLWRRYLKHNPRFVFLILLQLLGWPRPQRCRQKGMATRGAERKQQFQRERRNQ